MSCRQDVETREPGTPNLLLITVDTLRPDALGWIGGTNDTPAIDGLAREGFRFPAAVSPAPLTLPAHVSMMTGLVPPRHGVRDNGQVLGSGASLLAEILARNGYTTAGFISGYPLRALFGVGRGFGHFDDTVTAGEGAWLERPAAETTAAALAWHASAEPPWFLWVHYYDPHYPYTPPPSFERPGRRGSYDGEVAFTDAAIGELLRGLDARPRDSLLTVFAADHGESLGEHGEGTHGFFAYDSTLRVPMIFHWPGRIRPGESLAAARLVDTAPTVLELVGRAELSDVDGVSLVPTLRGERQGIPPAYFESLQPWTSYGWSPLRGVLHRGWKLIEAPRPELYDLRRDPEEQRNLVDQEPSKASELRQHLAGLGPLGPLGGEAVVDATTLSRLRALGYLGSGSPPGQPPLHLADPKDRAHLRELLTEADELSRQGRHEEALVKFEAVLAEDPDNRFAVTRSGEALLRQGDTGRAVGRLHQAVQLDREGPETRALLAEALFRSGDYEASAAAWTVVTRLQPGRASAWSNLGAALGKSGRLEAAVEAYARAAKLEPHDADRMTRLAFSEHAAGRTEAATRHLKEAAGLTGGREFAHSGALGLLLLRMGQRQEARSWLERSTPAEGDFAEARLQLAILEVEDGNRQAGLAALREALHSAPQLRSRVASDPRLASLDP